MLPPFLFFSASCLALGRSRCALLLNYTPTPSFAAPLAAANSGEEGLLGEFGKESAAWIILLGGICVVCFFVIKTMEKEPTKGSTARIRDKEEEEEE